MNICKLKNGFYVGHRVADEYSTWSTDEVKIDPPQDMVEGKFYQLRGDGVWVECDAVTEPLAPVPESVSPRQIRQALTRVGLRAQIEATVAAADQDTQDWYAHATEFLRQSSVVLSVAAALGVSDEELDNLWRLASAL